MAPSDSGSRIVRTWTVTDAPTGEGTRYETEDGRVWAQTMTTPTITGVTYAKVRRGRIEPR